MSDNDAGELDLVYEDLWRAQKRIEALEAALRDADTACFKLCVNHGFATGHGDTVVAMIEEIDAQIASGDRRSVIELIKRIEALEAALQEIIEASQGDDEIDTDWMEYLDKIEKIARAALDKDDGK